MTVSALRIAAFALAAIPTCATAANPSDLSAPPLHPGDSWVFQITHENGSNGFTQSRQAMRVQRIDSDSIVVGVKIEGAPTNFEDHVLGMDWSQRRLIGDKEVIVGRPFQFPMAIGNTWTVDYVDPAQHGSQTSAHFHQNYKVVGWEDVTTAAGTFHAMKIEATYTVEAHMAASTSAVAAGATTLNNGSAASQVSHLPERTVHEIWREQIYYAPEVKYFVKVVTERYNSNEVRYNRDSQELASYTANP